jgi:hypothetical protein
MVGGVEVILSTEAVWNEAELSVTHNLLNVLNADAALDHPRAAVSVDVEIILKNVVSDRHEVLEEGIVLHRLEHKHGITPDFPV